MDKEITAYEPLSAAKITGITYIVLGLIMGAFYAVLGMNMPQDVADSMPIMGLMFGWSALFWMPLFYGIMGFLIGFVGALFYNWLAARVGGIVMTLEDPS